MRIDSLKTQYEIPGFEIAPRAFEPEEAGEDYENAPFSLDVAVSAAPSPVAWQDVLGLTRQVASPISIEPPSRQNTGRWKTQATASYRMQRDVAQGTGDSQAVSQMMSALAEVRDRVAQIRSRAREMA